MPAVLSLFPSNPAVPNQFYVVVLLAGTAQTQPTDAVQRGASRGTCPGSMCAADGAMMNTSYMPDAKRNRCDFLDLNPACEHVYSLI